MPITLENDIVTVTGAESPPQNIIDAGHATIVSGIDLRLFFINPPHMSRGTNGGYA